MLIIVSIPTTGLKSILPLLKKEIAKDKKELASWNTKVHNMYRLLKIWMESSNLAQFSLKNEQILQPDRKN